MYMEMTSPRKLVSGAGALEHVKTLKGERAFIVMSGAFAKRNPTVAATLESYLKEAGFAVTKIFSEGREPTLDYVRESAKIMEQFAPDHIFAVGGGSTLDAAKIMKVIYEFPDISDEALFRRFNLPSLERKASMVAIPTTSGTGSEVTPFNMVFVKTGNAEVPYIKNSVADYQTIPDVVILDPAFTISMSPEVTANTGLDALVHAIEAYTSKKPKNIFSDLYTLEAIRTIVENLPIVYKDGANVEARAKLQYASMMAGIAIANRGTGLAHGIGNPLGAFGVAHGVAVALVLDAVMKFNFAFCRDGYREIAVCLGVAPGTDEAMFQALMDKIAGLKQAIAFPAKITAFGISGEAYRTKIDFLAQDAVGAGSTLVNPRTPTVDDIKQILTSIC